MLRTMILRRIASLAVVAVLAACSDPATSPPPSSPSATDLLLERTAALVECPSDLSLSASALIGPLGGEVSVGGHRIIVPRNAFTPGGFKLVTLVVPPSRYVEIEARVDGLPHFEFDEPVTVVVDYSRCARTNIDQQPLRVWHIEPLTNTFLEDMGGVDDKQARTVTFTTDHFSGYAIAQ